MLELVVLLLGAQEVDFSRELAAYREQTRARVECRRDSEDEVVVCARREADEYRVPFIAPNTGERDNLSAFDARAQLVRLPNACETKISAMPYGCGFAGVTATSSSRGLRLTERELAP